MVSLRRWFNSIQIYTKKLWLIIILLVAFKLFLCSFQMMFILPDDSKIDDALMFRLAQNIDAGNWLGEYNWLTLSKHSFYALWLAILSWLGINVIVGGQMLYAFCCIIFLCATKPLFKHNASRLLIFTGLLYLPQSYAEYTLRIYRDNIYTSLVIIGMSALLGAFIRYKEKPQKVIVYEIIAGISLGAAWLTHEDNILLIPFIAVTIGIYFLLVLLNKHVKQKAIKLIQLLVPVMLIASMLGGWVYMNKAHYGRYIISDYTSSEFQDAVGAMIRACPEEQDRYEVLPYSTRMQLYEVSPAFKTLQPYLESNSMYTRYGDAERRYLNPSTIQWTIREAAQSAGH